MAAQDLFTALSAVVDPAHTAVLVIDVQNDFCAPGGHTEVNLGKDVADCQAVVGPIRRLVAAARGVGVPVIWVKADLRPRLSVAADPGQAGGQGNQDRLLRVRHLGGRSSMRSRPSTATS